MQMHKRDIYFGIFLIKVELQAGDVAEHMITSRVKSFIFLQQGGNAAVMDGIWAPAHVFIYMGRMPKTYLFV